MKNLYEVLRVWFEAVGGVKVSSPKQIPSCKGLLNIVKTEKCKNLNSFLGKLFPNFKSDSPILGASLTLVYAAFSDNPECSRLRAEVMVHLDTNVQLAIQEYLRCFTGTDFKDLDAVLVTKAAEQVPEVVGASVMSPGTPSRMAMSPDTESPLQRFFQTPRRNDESKKSRWNCKYCGNGERIIQMQAQMEEDEAERNQLVQAHNDLKSVLADLEKKLSREVSRNDNLAANSLGHDVDLAEKDKLIKSLEDKCQDNLRLLSVLQDDLNYTQKCLSETTDRLTFMEKEHADTVNELKETEAKHAAAISNLDEFMDQKVKLEKILEARSAAYQELEENYLALKQMERSIEPDFDASLPQSENLGDQLLNDARREISELVLKLETAEAGLKDFERIVREMERQRVDDLSALETARNDAKLLEVQLNNSTKEIEDRVAELHVIYGKLANFEVVVQEKDAVLKDVTTSLENLQSDYNLLRMEQKNLSELLQNSKTELGDVKLQLSESEIKNEENSKKLESVIDGLNAELLNLTELIEKRAEEKMELYELYMTTLEKLSKSEEELNLTRAEKSTVAAQNADLATVVEAQNVQITALEQAIQEIESVLKQRTCAMENSQLDFELLLVERDNVQGSLQAAESALADLKSKLSISEDNAKKSESLIENLKAELSQLTEKHAEKQMEFDELYMKVFANLEKSQEELGQIRTEKSAVDAQNVELAAFVQAQKLQIQDLEQAIVKNESLLNERTSALENSQLNIELLLVERDNVQDKLQVSKSEFADLTVKLSQSETQSEENSKKFEAVIDELKSELSRLTEKHAEEKMELYEVHTKALEKLEKTQLQLECITREKSELHAEHTELAAKVTVQKAQISSLEQKIEETESLLKERTAELENSMLDFELLLVERDNVQSLLQANESELADLKLKLSESEENAKTSEASVEILKADLSQLTQKRGEEKVEFEELYKTVTEKLEKAQLELQRLETEESALKTQNTNLAAEAEAHNAQISSLKQAIEENESVLQRRSSELKNLQSQYESLAEERTGLQDLLEASKTELTDLTLKLSQSETQSEENSKKLETVVEELQAELSEMTEKRAEEKMKFDELGAKALGKLEETQLELRRLEIEESSLQAQNAELTAVIETQKVKIFSLEQVIEENESVLQLRISELKILQSDYELLLSEQKGLQDLLEASKTELVAVTAKLSSTEAERLATVEKLQSESEMNAALCEDKTKLEEKLENLQETIQTLEKTVEDLKTEKSKLEKVQIELVAVTAKLSQAEAESLAAIKKLQSESEKNSALCEDNTKLEEKLQETIQTLEKTAEDLKTEKSKLETVQTELVAVTAKLSSTEAERLATVEKLQSESEKNAALCEYKTKLEEKLENLQETIQTLEKTVEDLKTEKSKLETVQIELVAVTAKLSQAEAESLAAVKKLQSESEKNSALFEENTKLEEKLENLQETIQTLQNTLENLTNEKSKLQTIQTEKLTELSSMASTIHEKQSLIEQQAVEFNREKMQLIAQLEMHQRESATALRHLEAKNLALDEVKNVAMAKVNELLGSHGQLRRELDDLVANKSAENTKLGLEVTQARTKCLDLRDDLAQALTDVEGFKQYVKDLKKQRDNMLKEIDEKNKIIEEMKINQAVQLKRLVADLAVDGDLREDDIEKIVDNFKTRLDERKNSWNEVIGKLQADLQNARDEKRRIQSTLDSAKIKIKFWANPLIRKLVENTDNERFKDILLKFSTAVDDSPLADDGVEAVLDQARDHFIKLLNDFNVFKNVFEAREQVHRKFEDDYRVMEERMLSLAETNSRLATEIMKTKGLSSVELALRENEVTSLRSTVSELNEKIEELSMDRRELEERLEKAVKERHALVDNVAVKLKEISQVILLKRNVDKALGLAKANVPEMLTVVTTLEQRQEDLFDTFVEAIWSHGQLGAISTDLKKILGDLELIQAKKPSVEDLSDSLEEVAVQEKTFQIINLHEDTFSMPPRVVEQAQTVVKGTVKENPTVWTVSPPSKRKQSQPAPVKKERSVNGESWVIPVGPAPAKPARKTEPRPRSNSTSSTRSLPVQPVEKVAVDFVAENKELRAVVDDLERKLVREREQFEDNRSAIRLKYEKQLDLMKDEMKNLYNQEITKHKSEQSKMADELKRKNEELRKQNAAYKEDIDDLRSQLWSLGDKLLLNEQTKKRDEDRLDLSRQFDRINLQSVDSWKSGIACGESTGVDGSRGQQRFMSMPVEDEEEIFDNRCLEDLKAGRPTGQDRQTRLTELQIRNSLCLPHLKSSYPVEMQFVSPQACKESDLKSTLPFASSESQSLTDSSDPSMTKSLLPTEKSKKKEQPSYKRPGPPTPSKNGRPSLSGDVKLTPKRPLREQNQRGTPSRLKALFTSKSTKRESLGGHDENVAPSTPRGKGLRIFQRKPFGGRDF